MQTRIIIFLFLALTAVVGTAQDLPPQFDLRDDDGENYVTPVRDQEGYNSWAFASLASMESNLMVTDIWSLSGEEGLPDLAEYHMDWWNGFNTYHNSDTDKSRQRRSTGAQRRKLPDVGSLPYAWRRSRKGD
ncbi:MAG: hypothetical protein U5L09_02215 [Bacteroidales bacterium]|nr:hypothetical protein [Bacteroidales bacterium]